MTKEEKIQSWEKHLSLAKESEFYSIRRIDILTISISGACIYIVFEILRFLNSAAVFEISPDTQLLKISAIASVLAIAINFLSQITGYIANQAEAIYANEIVSEIRDAKYKSEDAEKQDKKSIRFSKWTHRCNVIATVFMILGITTLVYFNLITF